MTKRILVIGESCLDVFVYCHAIRLAPDIPVPVLEISETMESPGMAMNVKRNIESLIDRCELLTNSSWRSVTKTRYIHSKSNHMFFRVDSPHDIQRLDVQNINFDYDLVVIADYQKGFLMEEDIKYICSNHPRVFVDTKKPLGPWVNNALFVKINDYEYQRSLPSITAELTTKIIHTVGADGCIYNGKRYPVESVEVVDTSGAGDSFMSALVVKYLETNNIEHSITFANKCASEVVKRRGVSTI